MGGPAPMTPVPMPVPMAPITQPPMALSNQPPHAPGMQPPLMAPPGAPPGSFAAVPQAPFDTSGAVMMVTPPADGAKPDLVHAVKTALLGGLSVAAPTATVTVGVLLAVMVPVSVLVWLFAVLLPAGAAYALGLLLGLAQAVALLFLVPAAFRHILAAHLGQPITPQAALAEVRAKFGDVFVNMLVPGIVLGIFAGPIYWLEGKKIGEVIGRNFGLIGRDVLTIILTWVALIIPVFVVTLILAFVFSYLGSLGLLLTLLLDDALIAVMTAYGLGLSTWYYFDLRRRFETADPEGEARARLGAAALPSA